MSYIKTVWVNGETPLNQENLNKLENAIDFLHSNLGLNSTQIGDILHSLEETIARVIIEEGKSESLKDRLDTLDLPDGRIYTIEVNVSTAATKITSLENNKADIVDGKVPGHQLPGYLEEVIEGYFNSADELFYLEDSFTTPVQGESGKIYIDFITHKIYRYAGGMGIFAVISETLALGETASTAYRGDRGKIAYDHSQDKGNPHNITPEKIGAYSIQEIDAFLELIEGGFFITAEVIENLPNPGRLNTLYLVSHRLVSTELIADPTLYIWDHIEGQYEPVSSKSTGGVGEGEISEFDGGIFTDTEFTIFFDGGGF